MTDISRRNFLTVASIAGATLALSGTGLSYAADSTTPSVPASVFPELPLPYPENALEPWISARTVGFHYHKHQLGALKTLNELLALPENQHYIGMSLEKIMLSSANNPSLTKLFNSAASVVNHDFYWHSLQPNGGDSAPPAGKLLTLINASFGDYVTFKTKFRDMGVAHTGSGYLWLVIKEGKLEMMTLNNLDNPLMHRLKPLLTIDIYEHAYYLDYQNLRKDYLQAMLDKLLNWNTVTMRLEG